MRSKAESSEEFRSELLAIGDKVLIEALVGVLPNIQNYYNHQP